MSENMWDWTAKGNRTFFALLLIVFGAIFMVFNLVTVTESVAVLILPLLGLAFLAWGLFKRSYAYTIPGCILLGLGAGVLLSMQLPDLSGDAEGGIIVLGLAVGFFGIAAMNLIFRQELHWWSWWPLFPGVILGLVGAMLTIGSQEALNLLELIGRYWPIVLVIIGLWLLFGRPRQQQT